MRFVQHSGLSRGDGSESLYPKRWAVTCGPLCRITRYKEEEYCNVKFVQQKHSSGLLEKLTTLKSTSVHQLKQIPKSFPGSPGLTHPMIHVQMTYTTADSTITVDLIGTGICQYLLKDYNPTNVIYADLNVEWG
jgi:hypothetical protein